MSTVAFIYFSHTHYDIKYVQIQNTSTNTAVLTLFLKNLNAPRPSPSQGENVVITYSRVQINRKVANPVHMIS